MTPPTYGNSGGGGAGAHIGDRAGFLAALAEDDPERVAAEQHARTCGACADALDEGHRLVSLLAEALPLAPPTQEALERAAAAIEKETATEQRRPGRYFGWAAAAPLVLVWGLQLVYGLRIAPAAGSLVTSLAVLGLAVVAVSFFRSHRRLILGGLIVASGVLASAVGVAAPLEPRYGVECALCELVAAAIPWLIVAVLARRRRVPLDPASTMAVAAAGALASQAAQLLSCPVSRSSPHLIVFHLGGVLLAAALGALDPLGLRRLRREPAS